MLLLVFGFLLVVIVLAIVNKARRARVAVGGAHRDEGLARLRAHDSGFDPAAFEARGKQIFQKVNDAWIGGQMATARRLVSDGVYVRFQTQLAMLRAQGLKNAMTDFRVVSTTLLAAEADEAWDTVHVKLVGEARDADVPLSATAQQQQQTVRAARLSQYDEVWSFVRRRGKQSKNGVPALSGRCPSCGADMPLSAAVRCEFCRAVVNSGEHDWVLAEITQPEEWRPRATVDEVEGLAELRRRDPSVSRQELEDRASVVFWKWAEARATGRRTKLDRFCLLPGRPEVVAAPLSRVAVGSAEVTRVRTAEEGSDGYDRVQIELAFSAVVGRGDARGAILRLTLARAAGALSKRGLSSLDCPHCGGALAESDDVKCGYCGETLTGGKYEWALEEVSEAA